MNLTTLPTRNVFLSRHEIAMYHNQTGDAEEMRVMI
jgi:hypothetical protein